MPASTTARSESGARGKAQESKSSGVLPRHLVTWHSHASVCPFLHPVPELAGYANVTVENEDGFYQPHRKLVELRSQREATLAHLASKPVGWVHSMNAFNTHLNAFHTRPAVVASHSGLRTPVNEKRCDACLARRLGVSPHFYGVVRVTARRARAHPTPPPPICASVGHGIWPRCHTFLISGSVQFLFAHFAACRMRLGRQI